MIAFRQHGNPSSTPCDDVDLSEKTFFTWKQNDCINYMRKTANIDTEICLPHEVLIGFLSELYANVFEKYFIGTVQAFDKATEGYGYFGKIFAFAILMMSFISFGQIILGTTVSSFFKHGFSGIFSSKRRTSETPSASPSRRNTTLKTSINDENLTIFLAKTLEESQALTRLALENQSRSQNKQMTENRIEDVRDEVTDGAAGTDDTEEFEHIVLEDDIEKKIDSPSDEKPLVAELTEDTSEILKVNDSDTKEERDKSVQKT